MPFGHTDGSGTVCGVEDLISKYQSGDVILVASTCEAIELVVAGLQAVLRLHHVKYLLDFIRLADEILVDDSFEMGRAFLLYRKTSSNFFEQL